jgi:hypothetical protein
MKKSIWELKKLSLVFSCLFISSLTVQSQTKNRHADQTGFFYTDTLSWSGATKEIILSGKTSVVLGKNKFKGNGSFSILGKANLLIVDGKQLTPDSLLNTSGKKCRIVTLAKDGALKKYGLAGGSGVVEITIL